MKSESTAALRRQIERAFPAQGTPPAISLRAGNALDDYDLPPPFDADLDDPTDEYIEAFHWGIHFLDPNSWRYYLPILLTYSLSQMESGRSSAVDTFLFSLLPPDDPPRFDSLSGEQKAAIEAVLETIGFSDESKYQEEALQALQECWGLP